MRKSQRAAARTERMASLLISVLAGTGALAVTSVLLSLFAVFCDLSDRAVNAMSGIALAAGCFACAFCAANRRRRQGLLFGFICGICVFCVILVMGVLTVKIFSAEGFFIKLLIILSASAIGGIKGVNSRPLFRG